MIILDTSVWIEHLKNNNEYFPKICNLMENQEILAIDCVFGELLQGVKNKNEKEIIKKYWNYLPKIKYENIIIEAGEYSANNKLLDYGIGLIDAIIIVYGIKSNSKIWTLDKKLIRILSKELKYKECPNII